MKVVFLVLVSLVPPAWGLIFFEASSPPANTETAPTGVYAGGGWQHQIILDREAARNLFFGTIISPKHFVTARHLSLGTPGTDSQVFVQQPGYLTGAADRTYTFRNATAPAAINYTVTETDPDTGEVTVTVKATDLYIYEIWETFPSYAEIYTPADGSEIGKEIVMTGFGDIRGNAIMTAEGERGWGPDSSDRRGRWGTNRVDGTTESGSGPNQGLFLYCDFDAIGAPDNPDDPDDADATPFECQAAGKDSGGGWFIKSGGVWKLAGINYSVDTYTTVSGGGGARWAIYDGVGLYPGGSTQIILPCFVGLNSVPKCNFYRRAHTYATRVSEHADAINAVIQPAKDFELLSPLAKFERWAQDHGLPSGTQIELDFDQDGLTNLEEYLTESDPGEASDKISPLTVDLTAEGVHRFTLVESLDLSGRGLTSVVEVSGNLSSWAPLTGTTEISNSVDSLAGTRTRVLTVDYGGPESVYYRLKISL